MKFEKPIDNKLNNNTSFLYITTTKKISQAFTVYAIKKKGPQPKASQDTIEGLTNIGIGVVGTTTGAGAFSVYNINKQEELNRKSSEQQSQLDRESNERIATLNYETEQNKLDLERQKEVRLGLEKRIEYLQTEFNQGKGIDRLKKNKRRKIIKIS